MHGEDRPNIKTQLSELIMVALKFAEFPDHISIDYMDKQTIETETDIERHK